MWSGIWPCSNFREFRGMEFTTCQLCGNSVCSQPGTLPLICPQRLHWLAFTELAPPFTSCDFAHYVTTLPKPPFTFLLNEDNKST